jgi:hypothetical protein
MARGLSPSLKRRAEPSSPSAEKEIVQNVLLYSSQY